MAKAWRLEREIARGIPDA